MGETAGMQRRDRALETDFCGLVYQDATVGQIVLDVQMELVSANQIMFRYFERKNADARGKNFGRFFHCLQSPGGCLQCPESADCGIWESMRRIQREHARVETKIAEIRFRVGNKPVKSGF